MRSPPRLTDGLGFPYLHAAGVGRALPASWSRGRNAYTRLGGTIDDAPGEARTRRRNFWVRRSRAWPSVERAAREGDPRRFTFPRPLRTGRAVILSLLGLKTALMRARDAVVAEKGGLTESDRNDLCAGFQTAIAAVLVEKSRRVLAQSPVSQDGRARREYGHSRRD